MIKYRLIGLILIVLSIIVAKYGDKKVNKKEGGIILQLFSYPKSVAKTVKWVSAFFLLWFGLWFLFTNEMP
jgi:hypothetical protein